MFVHRYEVSKRKVRNKKVGESSKLKYKVKKETKVFSTCTYVLKINCANLNSCINVNAITDEVKYIAMT